MEISTSSVPPKNRSTLTTFSKTHRQTQRIHSWIGLGLRNRHKLVPCQTNSQILSYDTFSGRSAQEIWTILDADFPWIRIILRAETQNLGYTISFAGYLYCFSDLTLPQLAQPIMSRTPKTFSSRLRAVARDSRSGVTPRSLPPPHRRPQS